ncbi:MAG TPA: gamma-glutamyltransferase [Bryobacteraceae bacterium]|nr:gamma-glutamyltransferase [Bryobacteraceae bacterium]
MSKTLAFLLALPLLAQNPHTMFPPVRGTREMIGGGNNLVVAAGYSMLEKGGNAIDAGVAATLAAAVTEQDHFGLGGEMPLIVKMNGKPVTIVSGIGLAPKKATVEYYQNRPVEPWEQPGMRRPPIPGQGIRAAITPGMIDGLLIALERFGTKSFAEVAAPAIEDAETFPSTEIFTNVLTMTKPIVDFWPASHEFYFPNGSISKPGELVHMPHLAATLREMAAAEKKARGNRAAKIRAVHDVFYKGEIAKRIAAFNEVNGGLITYDDMASFHAEFDEPRTTTYRGYTINKPGFFTQGPVMLETLNILEGFDLKAMGHNSPEFLQTVIEAVKLAFADRDRYYGDPKFSKIPEEVLLSKAYAAERRKLIDPARASRESRPGDLGVSAPPQGGGGVSKDRDTTCVNVVDHSGNAFSATPSGAWLPSVIAGDTGIPLSMRLTSFVMTPGHANQLAPGKRPRVTLSPTMITKDGEFYMELSTPGGDNQDQALLQVLLNVIDFGMTPQEAVEAPRFQTEHFYASFDFHEIALGRLSLEGRFPRQTIDRMIALGHHVQVGGEWSNPSAPVVILKKDGALSGAADPRRGRFVFGR